jgi:hypothetical protein
LLIFALYGLVSTVEGEKGGVCVLVYQNIFVSDESRSWWVLLSLITLPLFYNDKSLPHKIYKPCFSFLFLQFHLQYFLWESHIFETGPAWRVDPWLSWPGSGIGPGLSKNSQGSWSGETQSTRQVYPEPGRPG